MNYLSLILRIVAILAAITAGVFYFLSEGKLDEKKNKLAQLQTELQVLKDKNESANLEIVELQENLTTGTKYVEEGKIKLEEAQAKLVVEMQESQRVQKELIETQKKVTQLQETTTRLRKELVNAENLFAAASQENLIAQLKERIEELTSANARLQDRIKASDIPDENNLSADTEPPQESAGSNQFRVRTLTPDEVSSIEEETKIVSLSLSNGIIVLDATPKLKPGITVDLVKDSEAVARVEIVNVNGSLAISYIRPGAKIKSLSKGDIVKILR